MVSVSEMARQCGLSRSRFYQLVGTAFPFPVYDVGTRRPFYPVELQQVCLEVRRRNCGIDGKPVMFYAKRVPAPKPRKVEHYGDLLDGLRALGLTTATGSQITSVVQQLYPAGIANAAQSEVLRAVFLHLKRQNSGDKVG
jgi:hypothetical protein